MTEWCEVTRESINPESRNWADWYVDQIKEEINEIESKIGNYEEIQIIVPIDNGINVIPDWFGYRNPNLVIVKGIDHNNNPTTAFIPRTRFTALLSIIKKDSMKKKKVYGFQVNSESDE